MFFIDSSKSDMNKLWQSTCLVVFTAWKVFKYEVISGLYFPTCGLNTEIYFINLRIQSECGKIWTRNNCLDTFHKVIFCANVFEFWDLPFIIFMITNFLLNIHVPLLILKKSVRRADGYLKILIKKRSVNYLRVRLFAEPYFLAWRQNSRFFIRENTIQKNPKFLHI